MLLPDPTLASDEADRLFKTASDRAMTVSLPVAELINAAEALKALGRVALACDLYKAWIAFNPDDPLGYAALFNHGIAMAESGDRIGAISAFRSCIRLKPDFYPPYVNLGRCLEDAGHAGAGVLQWLELSNKLPQVNGSAVANKLIALQQAGRVLEGHEKELAAEDALKQCLDVDPGQQEVLQHWLSLRQRQCRWPVVAPWERASREALAAGISPLSLANLADDPMFQLARAARYNRQAVGFPKAGRPRRFDPAIADRHGDRLRIGYVSSDLREHAVGFGLTEVMELHDRARVDVYAYYCGIDRADPTKDRIMAAVDHWIDINPLSDEQAAARIAADEIDILIDVNGNTRFARTKVFALRPAPVAVNWFGYPGTMGSPYHHYMVADAAVVPAEAERFYAEKVLHLTCYQPNDRKRTVSAERPTRADENLPEGAVVFCCLNGMQKLTAITFARWMTILQSVPQSVLWLLTGTDETNERLRKMAAERGIAPERLIFARKKPNPDHLARYPLADLFLDTLPYGAHTTAADAMWMGVPILTLPGRSFAARVCASLVGAAGMGELICTSPDHYVARAIEFGRDPAQLARLRQQLASNRDTCALFDTPRLVREIETLYRQMWQDFAEGRLPIPDLDNLEAYHDIGTQLDLENVELLSDPAYVALYRDKLTRWDEVYPLKPDIRLWP